MLSSSSLSFNGAPRRDFVEVQRDEARLLASDSGRLPITGRTATTRMPTRNNEEYAEMHFVNGFCDGNSHAALREYQHRYQDRRLPYGRVLNRVLVI
jgi:hypothetical protein